jgi:hypothetical protein
MQRRDDTERRREQVRERLADKLEELRNMNRAAEQARRSFSRREQVRWEELQAEARDVGAELRELDAELTGFRSGGGSLRVRSPGDDEWRDAGGVADQVQAPVLSEFRARGWKLGEPVSMSFADYRQAEMRTAAYSGTIANMTPQVGGVAAALGADRRYFYPSLPQVPVENDVTSVSVLRQASRTLPTATSVVRAIDAVTAKPQVDSGLETFTQALSQVAAISTNTPRVIYNSDAAAAAVEQDLRLAVSSGLDKLAIDAAAASPFTAPGTNLLIGIRSALTDLWAAGYNPDTIAMRPADSQAIDLLVSGISGGTADFVFGAGSFAPGQLFGLNVRVVKDAASPYVFDSGAWARLYTSPVSLQTFEADAGTTNRINVRLECHGTVAVERAAALRRIAAS